MSNIKLNKHQFCHRNIYSITHHPNINEKYSWAGMKLFRELNLYFLIRLKGTVSRNFRNLGYFSSNYSTSSGLIKVTVERVFLPGQFLKGVIHTKQSNFSKNNISNGLPCEAHAQWVYDFLFPIWISRQFFFFLIAVTPGYCK